MTPRPVDAVFFWRYSKPSVHKPVYGRFTGSTTYTKDYLQPNSTVAPAFNDVLGPPTQTVDWRWPGGNDAGGKYLLHDDDGNRVDIRWSTATGAPKPWRLTPNPGPETIEVLAGDPAQTTEAGAAAEIDNVVAAGEEAWLIAVHLYGEGPVLHPRVVLGSPLVGREYASTAHLPPGLQSALNGLPASEMQGVWKPGSTGGSPMRAKEIVDQVLDAFKTSPNVLLVGPPGTGKTVAMEDIREAFANGLPVIFDPTLSHQSFTNGLPAVPTEVRSVVFHPSFAYEHMVVGLLPDVDPTSQNVIVKPHVGPLIELAVYATQPGHRALLVCDEFNRGNAAAIFGDTLALLDADKRHDPAIAQSGAEIDTPFRHLNPLTAAGQAVGPHLRLPKQLFVLAAMNSADRSVAPLDAALRRRFAIIYVGPDYAVLRAHLGVPETYATAGATNPGEPTEWTDVEHAKAVAVAVLERLNERIEAVLGRDFQLGHSTMWHIDGADASAVLRSIADALDRHVTGTLQLSFADNDAALAAVLNAPTDPAAEAAPSALASWHLPPGNTAEVASPRLRVKRLASHSDAELLGILAALVK